MVYILKCVGADHRSLHPEANGFQYPELGEVEAPDFDPKPECGHGLHGFLWGKGNGALAFYTGTEVWKVIAVEENGNLIHIDQEKVKFKNGTIVFSGTRKEATDFLRPLLPQEMVDKTIIGEFLQVGDGEKTIGGDYSTVSGGNHSTISGGYSSTVSGGNHSTISGGSASTVSGGYGSTVSGGHGSTVSGGDYSTVSGGNHSIVSGGDSSTVSGGDSSQLRITHWNGNKYRTAIAYVGENEIEPNTKYHINQKFEFEKVS